MQPLEIQLAWKRMLNSVADSGAEANGFLTETTSTVVLNRRVRLGVSTDQHLSMLIPSDRREKIDASRKSAFISVARTALVVDGSRVDFINVECDEPQLIEVFAKVLGDILQRIENGHSSTSAIDEALKEFRRLLRIPAAQAPDIRIVAGLVGELLVLIELLKENDNAWAGWHGPDADRHDFRSGGISIETKTSLGADGRKVHINGIRQLEIEPDNTLIIRHIRLEPDPAGDLRVPDLARIAAELASNTSALESKLRDIGYTEQVAEGWGHHAFRKFDEAGYEVAEGFPRLVPGLLTVQWPVEGVSAVSYELDLGAANDFAIADENWGQIVREFCACL